MAVNAAPTLIWFRRDLRLSDHAALAAAQGPVIPVYIRDRKLDALGAAARWRLGLSLAAHGAGLAGLGSRLILRSGNALEVLRELVAETGAKAVFWQREYDPVSMERDSEIKAELRSAGIGARSFAGKLLWEPWEAKTLGGAPYKVFSPMWKMMKTRDPGPELMRPVTLQAPAFWPASEVLEDWGLGAGMKRGALVVARHVSVGEQAAQARLQDFVENRMQGYAEGRDILAAPATSGLSENLTYGEISPRQCWHAARAAMQAGGCDEGGWTFLKELAWRDFSWQLTYHFPHILEREWRKEWGRFPWNKASDRPEILAWKQGRTGIDVIDAAMRELYVRGIMHNRARMLVASYLTKHMMVDWRIGRDWFAQTLIDWDEASNAASWQWVAGCGADAAPYFRIFNPETQAAKFDKDRAYVDRWLGKGDLSQSFYAAIPESWGLTLNTPRPRMPVVDLAEGREAALLAYKERDF